MFGLTVLFLILLTYPFFFSLCEETKNVTAKTGENVTLQCQNATDVSIIVIKWKRPDLESDGYVFYFTDNRLYESYHLPSFRGRVKLRDPEMKNGDASVILKNVTVNDTGTYECVVRTHSSGDTDFRQSVTLKVTESGHTAGATEERGGEERGDKERGHSERGNLTAPLLTVAVVICVVVLGGFVLWKRQRSQQQNSDPPPAADEAAELQTLSPPSSNHCEEIC